MVAVSIIVPVYNAERYIADTLLSVQAQTFSDYEVLIVDDHSDDNSFEIVRSFCVVDPRFSLVRNEFNSGAAKCRNQMIQISGGRFIAFLDADDLWHPDKLRLQILAMLESDSAMSCTAVDIISGDGSVLGVRAVPARVTYDVLAKRTPIVNSSVIVDLHKVGSISVPDIRRRQDFALWLKLIREHGYALGIPERLTSYRVHSESLSRNKIVSATYTWKVLRDIEGISFFRALYYFLCYSFKGIFARLRGLN